MGYQYRFFPRTLGRVHLLFLLNLVGKVALWVIFIDPTKILSMTNR